MTMDLENAFNQVDRSCFLREARRAAPGLARYSNVCRMNDSFVLFGPQKIPSWRLAQQGDALGPFLALGPGPPRSQLLKACACTLPRGDQTLEWTIRRDRFFSFVGSRCRPFGLLLTRTAEETGPGPAHHVPTPTATLVLLRCCLG